MSRWENAPTTARGGAHDLRDDRHLLRQLPSAPPRAVTLDIDDTVDVVHGHQQLSLLNAHYDERCFLPIHVYDTATSPPGRDAAAHRQDAVGRRSPPAICAAWCAASAATGPTTRITIRGDGHYGRPEVMAWCEANGVDYVFGLPGNAVLRPIWSRSLPTMSGAPSRAIRRPVAAPLCRDPLRRQDPGRCERRVVARIEASTPGLGHPLRRDQPRRRQRRVALRHALLRPRPGREPDQAAQEPARLRSHHLPLGHSPIRCGSSCTPPPTG